MTGIEIIFLIAITCCAFVTMLTLIIMPAKIKKQLISLNQETSRSSQTFSDLGTLLKNHDYKIEKELNLLEKRYKTITERIKQFDDDFNQCACEMKESMGKIQGIIIGTQTSSQNLPIIQEKDKFDPLKEFAKRDDVKQISKNKDLFILYEKKKKT